MDHLVSDAEQHGTGLLVGALGLDELHAGALRGLHDRFGVGRVVLVPLEERLDVERCDQSHLVAQSRDLSRPVMGAAASLHDDDCRRLRGHKSPELPTGQPPPELHMPRHRGPMELENALCQVRANHHILCNGCRPFCFVVLSTTILAHCDAVWSGRQPPHLSQQDEHNGSNEGSHDDMAPAGGSSEASNPADMLAALFGPSSLPGGSSSDRPLTAWRLAGELLDNRPQKRPKKPDFGTLSRIINR